MDSAGFEELLKISKYLTKEYVEQQLCIWFEKKVKFINYEFGEGIGKGESYLSNVYRIKLYGEILLSDSDEETKVTLNIIVKSFPKNIGYRKTFRSQDFFENEISFYLKVLPKLLEFQSKKNIKDPFVSYPKIFGAKTDGENDFLALEDLSIFNYRSVKRQSGLDLAHCQMIIKCFAKYHAISFAYKDQHPEEFSFLTEEVFETYYSKKYWDWYKLFWKSLCDCAIDAVEKEYPGTIYVNKIREFATDDTFMRMIKASTERGSSSVFTHGDSWTPNFLMTYNSDTITPLDVKMIDFQWARPASCILDLSVFIYACTTDDIRKNHYDSLLKLYYDTLSSQIKDMDSDPNKVYPMDLFMDEIKKYSFHGLGFSLESTPVLMLEPNETFDMDAIKDGETVEISKIWVVKPMKSKEGRLRLCKNIIHAVDNGYI